MLPGILRGKMSTWTLHSILIPSLPPMHILTSDCSESGVLQIPCVILVGWCNVELCWWKPDFWDLKNCNSSRWDWCMLSTREAYLFLFIYLLWLYIPLMGLGRFFSFLILYTVERRINPSQGRYLHRINAHNTDIHALSGIRTRDPSVRASEDISCLRPRGHCDRYLRSLQSDFRRLTE
jgi:hypothetical protein